MQRWEGIKIELTRKGFVDKSESPGLLGKGMVRGCPSEASCGGPSRLKLFWSEAEIKNFVVCDHCGTVMDLQSMHIAR